jgi:hypothetical protein
MIRKISDDLYIDPLEILTVMKDGKDIHVSLKTGGSFVLSIYTRNGKEFLKYLNELSK